MPDALLEPGKFFHAGELFDDLIEVASVVAHIDAESHGVIDDDNRHCKRYGKRSTVKTLIIPHAGYHRSDKSGVRAGHMSVGNSDEGIFDAPTVF